MEDAGPGSATALVGTGTGEWVDGAPNEFLEFAVSPSEVSGVFFVAVEMDVALLVAAMAGAEAGEARSPVLLEVVQEMESLVADA